MRPCPPGKATGINSFFALDGKFPGVGKLKLPNAPRWGRKRGQMPPSSINIAVVFIDLRAVEKCHFKQFNVRFFMSVNVSLCKSAILIKTLRAITPLHDPWYMMLY